MNKLTAAGGVVYKENNGHSGLQVLLIHRRGVWDLPKGKQEEGESVRQCAVREVAEEVGLDKLPTITADLTETYHEYQQNGQEFGKTTYWYAMILDEPDKVTFDPQLEEDIEQVRWYPLREAKEQVGYENLAEVLVDFNKWYRRRI